MLAVSGLAVGVCLPGGAPARAALALLVALAAGGAGLQQQLDAAARGPSDTQRELLAEGVADAVRSDARGWRVDLCDLTALQPGALPPPRRVRLYGPATPVGTPAFEALVPGERVRVGLRLRAPTSRRNPGVPDTSRRLARQGIGATGALMHPALHVRLPEGDAPAGRGRWQRTRRRWGERLEAAGPGGALLRALALGDRAGLPDELRDAFARLGIAHLLAVSGLHLGLVAALAYAALRLGPGRSARLAARGDTRRLALAAALLTAGAYAFLAGWGVPVRRALVFLAALVVTLARARPAPRLQPLALAVLAVLAAEPQALFAAGAQLSFAAAAALLCATRSPTGVGGGETRRPTGAGGSVAAGLRTSATALAVTAPLAAWHFGSQAPFALLANLLAVPWTGLVLLPAALLGTLAAGLEGGAAAPVLAVAEGLAAASAAAALELSAWLPGSARGPAPATPWLLAAGGVGLAALAAQRTRWRMLAAFAAAALLWAAPPPRLAPGPPRAVFFDVGQGDATLVQGRCAAVLVDAGTALPGGADLGRLAVVPALQALGVERLDLAIASHADLDHRGGLPAVLQALPVGALWIPAGSRGEPGFATLLEAARRRGVPVAERGQGDAPLALGDLRVVPLWPPAAGSAAHRSGRSLGDRSDRPLVDRNDRSLVVRVEVAGRRVLLVGDLEARGEAALLASGADLAAEILKLPHHGSRTSSTGAFLAAVGAVAAVASAPCGGRFSMPHPSVVGRARAAGLTLWWTGRDGAVRVGLGPALHVVGSGAARSCSAAR